MIKITLFALMCLLVPVAAHAAGTPAIESKSMQSAPLLLLKQNPATHPEKILMAFNKLAGRQPDFLAWAKKSPFLESTPEFDRDAIINRENNRLMGAWSALDTNQLLSVHTAITLSKYSTIQEELHLDVFTEQTFFSYSIYGENVAIVPKDIAQFGKIKITKIEMDEILKKAGGGSVVAEVLMKPVMADAKEPFMRNNVPYWLLLGDIAEMRFWNAKGENAVLLWMYRADWYKPKQDKSLLDLKSGGKELK